MRGIIGKLNGRDFALATVALTAVVALLVINDALALAKAPHVERIGLIPFIVAAGAYVAATRPRDVLRGVDWGTIVFFITMFITMEGIWRSGILNNLLSAFLPGTIGGVEGMLRITAASLVMSQILSNVPFVKLFMEYMGDLGYGNGDTWAWVTLAMASTVAGNLTMLGATSNIIILEAVEARYERSISFLKFAKVGALVTLVNVSIYLAYMGALVLFRL